jgi:hypothetical protein
MIETFDMILFYMIMIAMFAIPAALATAIIAWLVSKTRIASVAPRLAIVIVGTFIPIMIAAGGFWASWPWPWLQPHLEAMRDGFPPGPWMLEASLPSWPLCLLTSRFVFRRR